MKIILVALSFVLFVSCNNSSNNGSENSDTVTLENTDMNTAPVTTDSTDLNGRNDTSTYEGAANDSVRP